MFPLQLLRRRDSRRGAAETGPAQRTAETKAREGPVCGGRARGPDSDSLEFGAIVSFVIGERVNARVAFKLGQVDVERLLLGRSLVLSLNFWGRRRDRWSKTRLSPRALCFRPNPTTKQLFCVIWQVNFVPGDDKMCMRGFLYRQAAHSLVGRQLPVSGNGVLRGHRLSSREELPLLVAARLGRGQGQQLTHTARAGRRLRLGGTHGSFALVLRFCQPAT